MNKTTLSKYLNKEKEEIDKAKWCEGEKIGKDPGQEFVKEWIDKCAKKFRKSYTVEDLKLCLNELSELKNNFDKYYYDMKKLLDKLNNIHEKVEEAKELLDAEHDKD